MAGCVEAPPCLGPTSEWQERQLGNFTDLKLYVIQMQDEIRTSKYKWKSQETQVVHKCIQFLGLLRA